MLIAGPQQQLLPIWKNTLSGINAIQTVTGLILPHHLSPAQNEFSFGHNLFSQKSSLLSVYLLKSEHFLPQYCALAKVRVFGHHNDAVFGEARRDTNKMVNCLPQLGIDTDRTENQIGISFCRDR